MPQVRVIRSPIGIVTGDCGIETSAEDGETFL